MWPLMPWLLIGAGIGAAVGCFGKCSSGGCPLTANWWRGALYGVTVGALLYFVTGVNGAAALNESTENVKRIGESQFDAEVRQSPLPVVADFYATWCGPCRMLSPRLDQLAGAYANRVKFVKVNVDEASGLARSFEIQAIPTLLFFRQGRLADRMAGLPAADELKARLESLLATNVPAPR